MAEYIININKAGLITLLFIIWLTMQLLALGDGSGVLSYKGGFTLDSEDETTNTGWYDNWTSGVGGVTILIVFCAYSNIWQLEFNPFVPSYSRYRGKVNENWSSWVTLT